MTWIRSAWVVLGLLALLGACGGGGGAGGFQPLVHTPLPQTPDRPPAQPGEETTEGPPGQSPILLDLHMFQRAWRVIGQRDFAGQLPNQGGGLAANTLWRPRGLDVGTDLWVADEANNRVLRFNLPLAGSNPDADLALGQPDLFTGQFGTTVGDLFLPTDVVIYENHVIVSDTGNHRVLIWTPIPSMTGAWSQVVVGQPDFVTRTRGLGRRGLDTPLGIAVRDGQLFVADHANNRVMIWNQLPTENHAPADRVLGQANFSGNQPNVSATGMHGPSDVWTDGRKLLVTDLENERVLLWNAVPVSDGGAADLVLGQLDMDADATIDGFAACPVSAKRGLTNFDYHRDLTCGPSSVDSNGIQIVVATAGSHSVMIWNSWPLKNRQLPDVELGQSDWNHRWFNDDDQDNSEDAAPTNRTLRWPMSVKIVGTRLYVTDNGNHRVLIFE